MLARALEVEDQVRKVLTKTHSKAGMHHLLEVSEGLDEWLDLKSRAVLNKKLQLIDALEQLMASWAIEVFASMVRGSTDMKLLRPDARVIPDSFHSLEKVIHNSKEQVKLRRRKDIQDFGFIGS